MGDDDFNRFGHINLQIVSLGPECNMLELIGSGLYAAGWNDDIGVVGMFRTCLVLLQQRLLVQCPSSLLKSVAKKPRFAVFKFAFYRHAANEHVNNSLLPSCKMLKMNNLICLAHLELS